MKPKFIATFAVLSLGALSFLTQACSPASSQPAESPEADAPKGEEAPKTDESPKAEEPSRAEESPRAEAPSRDDSPRSESRAESSKGGSDKPAKGGFKGIPMPVFPGLKFGMSLEQVAKLNDKDLDAEYKKKFLAASPSASLQVEDELRDKKQVFRRSRIEFLDTPTGIDQSALKGEYSYGNQESIARMPARTRDDGKEIPARNFFFFNDKLWKIYEEYKLGPKSNLGADFDSAVKKLSKMFGGDPAKVAADYQKGQTFDEAVWRDGEKIIRAVDRGDTLGMVFVDKSTQENLPKLRTHQLVDQHELDKDVKAATANPPTMPGPPKDADKDKKDGGKKDGKKK